MQITETILRKIAPRLSRNNRKRARQDVIIDELEMDINEMFELFEINTPQRQSFFLAQTCHESDGFCTTEEYASGRAYEGRRDLGNIYPGDGVKFKGHGLMQTTGRYNHTEFTKWCREHFPDCPDFEKNPEALTDFPWALLSALYYWDSRKLNAISDTGDFRKVTKIINGGYNGLEDRRLYLARASAALSGVSNSLLRLGMSGDDVEELQRRLVALGYRLGDIDGDFGPLTESAVRDFQAAQMLKVDGLVKIGGETWTELTESIADGQVKSVSENRATATGADLKESRIVASSNEGAGATISLGTLAAAATYWEQAQEVITTYMTLPTLFIALSVALNVYLLTRLLKARKARVEDHRVGKTV